MLGYSALFVVLFSILSVLARPVHYMPRASALNVAVCNKGAALNTHDCNVALLGLGPGGIAGAIQFLRVNAATASSTSGSCKVTVDAVDGGTTIDISKGRLEGHGSPNGGFDNLRDACPAGGSMVIGGGAKPAGNIKVTISAA